MEPIRSIIRSGEGRACKKLGGISDYGKPERVLGKGGFGQVQLLSGSKESPGKVAAKTVRAKEENGSLAIDFIRESSILISTRASGIAKLLDIEMSAEDITLFEVDAGRSLWSMFLSEDDFRPIFYSALRILSALELQGVVHGDIKAPNFLLKGDELTLIDFGAASQLLRKESGLVPTRSRAGTDYYLSPERRKGEPYNDRADVWAAACMWMTVVGPFIDPSRAAAPEDIIRNFLSDTTYRESWIAKFSPAARILLSKMLDPNPATRISARHCLEHPFFEPLLAKNSPVKQLKFNPRQVLSKRSERASWKVDLLESRADELSWLVGIANRFGFSLDVYFLAVKIFDFMLDRIPRAVKDNSGLYSVVCIYLSSKLLMSFLPSLNNMLASIQEEINIDINDFFVAERKVYITCCYTINYATSLDFVRLQTEDPLVLRRLRVLLRTSLARTLSDEELAKQALTPSAESQKEYTAEYTPEVDNLIIKLTEIN